MKVHPYQRNYYRYYRSYHAAAGPLDYAMLHDPVHGGICAGTTTSPNSPGQYITTICTVVTSRSSPVGAKYLLTAATNTLGIGSFMMQPTSGAIVRAVGTTTKEIYTPVGGNFVNAALVTPGSGIALSHEIPGIGLIKGVTEPRVGMRVKSPGCQTGVVNTGVITDTTYSASINHSRLGRIAGAKGQFKVTMPTTARDMGAAIMEEGTNNIVGMATTFVLGQGAGAAERRCIKASAIASGLNIDFTGVEGIFAADGTKVTVRTPSTSPAATPVVTTQAPRETNPSVSPTPDVPTADDFAKAIGNIPSLSSPSSGFSLQGELDIGGMKIPMMTAAMGLGGLLLLVLILKRDR